MRKILSIMLVAVLLLSSLFILTGCDNKENNDENVEKFEIEAKFGKLTFNLPKDTGYELKTDTNKGTLTHKDNKSTIEIYLMDTSKSSIIMKEKDFAASKYTDYKETEIAGHQAYSIRETNNFSAQYGIILDEYDKDHGKFHGLKIKVSKNSLKLDEFDPAAFVESDAFKTLLNSLKLELNAETETTDNNSKETKNYGEFENRTDGISDKKGLIFIKKYDSPKPELYRAEQKNDNVGIDNWLWYLSENKKYEASSIEVRIFPQDGTYNTIDDYKTKKGNMYTWSKTTIAGKEYDTFIFGSGSTIAKYSKYYQGAFMVGNRVVEFSYNMYEEIPDQDLGDTFFNQILDSIEYSESFK